VPTQTITPSSPKTNVVLSTPAPPKTVEISSAPVPRLAMAREVAQADAGAPAISAGQIEIRAQVTLTASLK
jgi:hypothetical protein